MTEFCDFPNCACKDLDPAGCRLPWRGPAEKAIAAKLAAAKPGEIVEAPPEYIHLVGYGEDHPDLEAFRALRAARRKSLAYKTAQAAFIGVIFAVGLFMATAVGFMTVWYLDAQAIEQAQQQGMDQ